MMVGSRWCWTEAVVPDWRCGDAGSPGIAGVPAATVLGKGVGPDDGVPGTSASVAARSAGRIAVGAAPGLCSDWWGACLPAGVGDGVPGMAALAGCDVEVVPGESGAGVPGIVGSARLAWVGA
jgi:hypothetical protein